MLTRQQRRAQYSSPSRSKPYCKPRHPERKKRMAVAGYEKVMRFIARGIELNRKRIQARVNPVAAAVRRGLVE